MGQDEDLVHLLNVKGDIEVTHREELEITSDEKQIFEEAKVMQQKKRTLKGWIVLCLLIPSFTAIIVTTILEVLR